MRRLLLLCAVPALVFGCSPPPDSYSSTTNPAADRVWIGPEFYANRLQDWRLSDGRIEAIVGRYAKPMRALHLLTHALSDLPGTVSMSVLTGPIETGPPHPDTWSGFLIGAGGSHVDFRISALVHHWPSTDGGLIVAVDGTGQIVVRDNSGHYDYRGPDANIPLDHWPSLQPVSSQTHAPIRGPVRLELNADPTGEAYRLSVSAFDPETNEALSEAVYEGIAPEQLSGSMALVSHRSPLMDGPGYWFKEWTVRGTKVTSHPERAFGPVMGAMYTLSDGVLKMTAQLGPLGASDDSLVRLEVRRGSAWEVVAVADIQPLSHTAHFRVEDWSSDDTPEPGLPYRVAYDLDGCVNHFEGTIRGEPADSARFTMAAFTGTHISGADGQWNSNHFWYPHSDIVRSVAFHNPDLLFFSGDQIYEGGLEGVVRSPTDEAALDYLGHWYRFVFAFRDLTRDRPTITIPDDHDAYHGNIWGNAGVREPGDFTVQDAGGYRMAPEWVNAMHRTQVSHLPDPVDPEPIAHGITTYHTRLEYGGISFAILADRMWKSPPSVVVPAGAVVNGWPHADGFVAARDADVPGAVLLGDKQERFLSDWATDWSHGAWMKVVLSQTPFADVATIPSDASSGAVLPGARIAEPGQYLEGDKLAEDMDSNGWPRSGRDRALRAMRKGFAFHVAGDQHLSHFIRYGVDEWNDAGHAFTVPSNANIWPRRWYPPEPGRNARPESPRNTGEFQDGFGNRMTVLAVANPALVPHPPLELYQRAPGYGIVQFDRSKREIRVEAWPRWVDASAAGATPYAGWPMTVMQSDQYARAAAAYLPTLLVTGMSDSVVRVTDEGTGEVLYALRIVGDRYRPPVFVDGGSYMVEVGEPGTGRMWTRTAVRPDADEVMEIDFR